MRIKNKIFIVMFFALSVMPSVAVESSEAKETQTITGTIMDYTNEPTVNANIRDADNPEIGCATDTEGKFNCAFPAQTTTIKISYVGNQDKILPISDLKNNPTITLSEDKNLTTIIDENTQNFLNDMDKLQKSFDSFVKNKKDDYCNK